MSLQRFFRHLAALKSLERTGWILKKVPPPRETVASHTYGAAMLGWLRATEERLDAERVIKMLLLHDLAESLIGDITPHEMDPLLKKKRENLAFRRLLKDIPAVIRGEAERLFQEFQSGRTREARLARRCDRLDTLLQAREYRKVVPGIEKEFLRTYGPLAELSTPQAPRGRAPARPARRQGSPARRS
ncbi:HD domain-containing protein [Candidatus Woesearchaeota archaeon]|nr:HD domain-containing protein [Candidatus Woesearchaeota archaeon]